MTNFTVQNAQSRPTCVWLAKTTASATTKIHNYYNTLVQ